jgi:hypothetical protein
VTRRRNRGEGFAMALSSRGLEPDVSIPFETESQQRSLEIVEQSRIAAVAIEVIDPEQPATACAARTQVTAGGGQQRAKV